MKKHLLLFWISLLILIPKTQFAQWSTVLDDGKYYIIGIDFKDENTGFAGGINMDSDSCVIIRTLDGGNSWEEVYGSPDNYVCPYCFTFINDTLIISGGQDGWLFKSTDGGENWEWYSYISGLNDINNILFFNESIGLARNKRTTDGGYTWETMEIGNTNDYFSTNDSSAFTSSSSGLYYTSDYGENWLKVNLGPPHTYSSVCMATDLVGYAVKYPSMIKKTIDGGMTWFEIDSLPFDQIKQIRFSDENNGYLLVNTKSITYGGSMRLLKTTDGGNTWDFVLFGTDYSYQMALAAESTILVPTINGIMYKTTNGGGYPILPHYTEIDWFSTLKYWHDPFPPSISINSVSQPYLMDSFRDTLFIDESTFITSSNPLISSVFILRYNTWGNLDWYTTVDKPDKKILGQSSTVDNYNNYYLIYKESEPDIWDFTTKLIKYSNEGDSLWTIIIDSTNCLNIVDIKIAPEENIIISGSFTGTFSFGNNNIHTDHNGIFILELDQDGNFVKLEKIVEAIYGINDSYFDISDEGSICLSFLSYGGPVFINADTLDPSNYYLLYLDQNLNVLWYNTNFDTTGKHISTITFDSSSTIILGGSDIISGNQYHIIYKYNEQGIIIDSAYIDTKSENSLSISSLATTTNNRILTGGNYKDLSILEIDTLYGFSRIANGFLYTLTDNLDFVKSSHISGTSITSLLENQHNSYLVGTINMENIIFADDTIIADGYDYFIAKLNSIITPISEKDTYNTVSIYPNPSSGIFNISFPNGSPKSGYFEIFSITGQKVYESKFSERNNTINLSNLEKGVYFIQFNLEGEIYSQKVILQ